MYIIHMQQTYIYHILYIYIYMENNFLHEQIVIGQGGMILD